jgi:D-3-phosphoglycerate dehydrogenase
LRLEGHEVSVLTEAVKDLDKLASRLADTEVVVLTQQRTRFPRALIEQLPRLRFISQTGRNTGHIDLAACRERGIIVSAIGGGHPHSTAELAWGLIIAALRHIPYEAQRLREGHWQSTVGMGLNGSTLGIYAYGRIGKLVADVGTAFGMRVLCWGRDGSMSRARADGRDVAASREQFYSESDVVSLHPLRDAIHPQYRHRAGSRPDETDSGAGQYRRAGIINAARSPPPCGKSVQAMRVWTYLTTTGGWSDRPC